MSRCDSFFIGLGSNLQDPNSQLDRALRSLQVANVELCQTSSRYRSEPVGGPPQPWFLNQVARVRFVDAPLALLRLCQSIERRQGRERRLMNGPRTLDVDLLLSGDLVLDSPALSLPHPRLGERRFVLVPLVEIAPRVIDPRSGLSLEELLRRCEDRSVVERVGA
ncbi:MAG TPA: 2-amino-4-hydroxy-6-hydroxymethyldihydropteridine diphosphokinase [Vicinamibacteria bacterium]|nr:2-amino-4-hydroxy-6-hydroxymethyldihydropteridine diphosphokinase [Vicinamibacteria bacterium]